MGIDEARQQGGAREIDDFGLVALGLVDLLLGADRNDLAVLDGHGVCLGVFVVDGDDMTAAPDLVGDRLCGPGGIAGEGECAQRKQ